MIAHYTDNRTQGIIARVVLALAAIPILAFAARLRERPRIAVGERRLLPACLGWVGVPVAVAMFTGGRLLRGLRCRCLDHRDRPSRIAPCAPRIDHTLAALRVADLTCHVQSASEEAGELGVAYVFSAGDVALEWNVIGQALLGEPD